MKKRATAAKTITPRNAASFNEICEMRRDNVSTREHWMITDGHTVTLATQKNGQAATESVSMPRKTFDAFADWYMTGTWKAPRLPRKR
jgi:hypothetical protein